MPDTPVPAPAPAAAPAPTAPAIAAPVPASTKSGTVPEVKPTKTKSPDSSREDDNAPAATPEKSAVWTIVFGALSFFLLIISIVFWGLTANCRQADYHRHLGRDSRAQGRRSSAPAPLLQAHPSPQTSAPVQEALFPRRPALRFADQLGSDATIVTVMCDTGMKYLSKR